METRTIAPASNVALVTTAPRLTPTPPKAARFGDVLASTAVRTAESAMTMLPGAPMMALAVRGGAAAVPLGTSVSGLTTPIGLPSTRVGTATAPEGPSAGGSSVPSLGAGGASNAGGGIEASIQQSQEMNLYMLGVQQEVQQQNQHFTTLSNVMKAQHDTVKTAIGNIR